jgi:hypothetical protein
MHHRGILNKAVHEHDAHAPVPCTRRAPFEQRPTDSVAPILRQDRHAKFRLSVLARKVGRANNRKIGIRDDENSVARQVDAFDIVTHSVLR